MIDKHFFSFYFRGEERVSPHQICIDDLNLAKEGTSYDVIELNKGNYIEERDYDDMFLWYFFHTAPLEIDSFLNFHLDNYSPIEV